MKKIYIILMHTNTIPSKLVKLATNNNYSHVAISLEKNCNIIYSFGRRNLYFPLIGGFTVESKNGKFFTKFNKTECKIYEINIKDEQYQQIEDIINNMKSKIKDYRYDFLGIIPRFFGIPITFKNSYVCSYFVASILEEAKIYKFNKQVCLINPKDFENLKGGNEIYKGRYSLYI